MNPTVAHIALQFAQIESTDYRSIIRFYEENILDILAMNEADKNFYNYEYLMALFNLGRYDQVLLQIDALIEYVFLEEAEYTEDSTYEWLIFKKGASLMNLLRFEEAGRIARDLVRINPANEDYRGLFLKVVRKSYFQNNKTFRSASIVLILVASLLSMFAWSLNNTLGPDHASSLFSTALGLNGAAVSFIGFHYLRAMWESKKQLYLSHPQRG